MKQFLQDTIPAVLHLYIDMVFLSQLLMVKTPEEKGHSCYVTINVYNQTGIQIKLNCKKWYWTEIAPWS